MSETATAQVTQATTQPESVTDSLGRTLSLRKVGALQKLRLFKACGANASSNPYLGMAMLASAVSAIDEIPVAQPVNEQQIEALVQRLGDEGLEAVGTAMGGSEGSQETVDAAKN